MSESATHAIGRTGLRVSRLGFGAAPIANLGRVLDEATALATIEAAYAGGVRYFDTAPSYGYGLSEHRIGHVLRNRPRADYVLSTVRRQNEWDSRGVFLVEAVAHGC